MEISRIAQDLRDRRFVITRLQDDSGVLLNTEDLLVFSLNETGLFLLEAIEEGRATVEEDLVGLLTAEFEVTEGQARQNVHEFVKDLSDAIAAE